MSELSLHPDLDQALFLAGVAFLYVLLALRVAPAVRATRQPTWLWPMLAVVVVGGLLGAHIYGESERTRIRSMLQGIAPAYAEAMVEMGLLSMSSLYADRGQDFRSEMAKRAADMVYIKDLAAQYGIPFELLFRPSNTPVGTIGGDVMEGPEAEAEGEDEPADQEEPEELDQPNS